MFFQRPERRPNVSSAMRDLLRGVSVKSMALLFLGMLAEHPAFSSQSGFCGHAGKGVGSVITTEAVQIGDVPRGRDMYTCRGLSGMALWGGALAASLSNVERNPALLYCETLGHTHFVSSQFPHLGREDNVLIGFCKLDANLDISGKRAS